jgi:hypothetical protein
MFTGVAVDGSTSFVAGESCPIDLDGETLMKRHQMSRRIS